MSVTGEQILAKAEANVGQHEVPMGSNSGPFVEACQHDTFLGGTGWPWCAAHVCRVAKDCGVPLAYNGAGAHDIADHHTASQQTVASAKPGDVCDWNEGTGHTSILKEKTSATTWTTVDGNWGDAVAVAQHSVASLRKVWRIPGVSDAPASPPRPVPVFVVTTSASGHRKVLFVTKIAGHREAAKRRVARWVVRHSIGRFKNGITIKRAKRVVK